MLVSYYIEWNILNICLCFRFQIWPSSWVCTKELFIYAQPDDYEWKMSWNIPLCISWFYYLFENWSLKKWKCVVVYCYHYHNYELLSFSCNFWFVHGLKTMAAWKFNFRFSAFIFNYLVLDWNKLSNIFFVLLFCCNKCNSMLLVFLLIGVFCWFCVFFHSSLCYVMPCNSASCFDGIETK